MDGGDQDPQKTIQKRNKTRVERERNGQRTRRKGRIRKKSRTTVTVSEVQPAEKRGAKDQRCLVYQKHKAG